MTKLQKTKPEPPLVPDLPVAPDDLPGWLGLPPEEPTVWDGMYDLRYIYVWTVLIFVILAVVIIFG